MTRLPAAESQWRKYTIDQLKADAEGSLVIGPFGSRMKADCYVPFGVPVIRGNNLSGTRALCGNFVYITDKMADSMRSCNAYADDLVFPHRGAIGEVGIVPRDGKRYMISTSLMKLACNRDLVNPLFLFYFFRSAMGRHELLKNASTVGTPGIGQPLTSLRSIRVPLPSRKEQDAIADILGTLDDKIELNRRMNETLEGMARAIFKSWFVDFDPVRAKAAGRQPTGMDAPTAALFPDRFEDSPLGKIPKGWAVGCLGDCAENPRRGVSPAELAPATPYIALEHMPRRSIALAAWGLADDVASGKFAFRQGEILFGKLRPYFHKVGVPAVDGVCSTDILVIVPRTSAWFGFILGHVSNDDFVGYTNAGSTGTRMPRTTWKEMARYEFSVPSDKIAAAFDVQIRRTVERIHANIHSSRTLAVIRDALLPKLLSGEISLRQLDKDLR